MKYRVLLSKTSYLYVTVEASNADQARELAYVEAGEQSADAWTIDQDAIEVEEIKHLWMRQRDNIGL